MSHFRRLAAICCLAALCFGQVAQAKVMIYYLSDIENLNPGTLFQVVPQVQRNLRIVRSLIANTGGQYAIARQKDAKTEWARAGYMVWGMGNTTPLAPNAGAIREQFDATIIIDQGQATGGYVGIRPDSLAKVSITQGGSSRTDLAKPMLQLRTNSLPLWGLGFACDSTIAPSFDSGPGKAVYLENDGIAFLTHAYVVGAQDVANHSAVRRILFGGIPQADYRVSNGTNSGATLGCRNCDSIMTHAAVDTCLLWDKRWGDIMGQASTVVFASPWGAGAAGDSIGSSYGDGSSPPTECDLTVLMCALAHLDSLSGHKVLGDKVIKIAPVVYGGLARGQRHSWNWNKTQGIFPPDTSSFYAYLDSLNALGIPITFAVNVDSASDYARDVIKLKSVAAAHFTPQVWDGVDDTTASATRYPQDVFGRYHTRIAIGDSVRHTIPTNDNSVCALASRSLAMCDSIFGADRASRVAVAPADDWSPYRLTGGQSALNTGNLTIDSVMCALQRAGYVGVIADAQDPDCNANKRAGPSANNPRGYYNKQMVFNSATIPTLRNFKILCHSGFNLMGGRSQAESYNGAAIDSSSAPPLSTFTIYKELGRAWAAALLDVDETYDLFPYDNNSGSGDPRVGGDILYRKTDYTQAKLKTPIRHGNIVRLSCADLSGASGSGIVPAATMYHVLKAMRNAMYVINKLAGRTVVTFAYPDDIDP